MSIDTLSRRLELDQGFVDETFNRIARHALIEPTVPLPFTPRSNVAPEPRKPADDLPPTPLDSPDDTLEVRRRGRHRAPRPSIIEWIGSRATRVTAVSMLGASLALTSAGSLLEDSLEKQTAYNYTLEEPAIVFPDIPEIAVQPTHPVRPATTPKVIPPKPTPAPKAVTPPQKPAPATTAKKPAVATDHWPAPGTNCNYLPKHQHKASETSATQAKAIFKKMVVACFGAKEWPAAEQLWQHESNFRPMAYNPNGGACGVVQSLPCSKLLKASGARTLGDTTVEKQARWGVRYVKAAYGTPSRAWRHWQARVRINGRDVGHWY